MKPRPHINLHPVPELELHGAEHEAPHAQVSDTISNSIRVVKTSKQAATEAVTYPTVIRDIIQKDGVLGLFGRGLKTKILSNGLQGDPCCSPP